ncbi:hypothetical protein M0R04_15915 [Candidatus Dojkabacteria bacterium]|jgi:hypothetical protein|nr:hypothetical protein [Candidatus Dojkabacteria bacterium]
MGKNVFVKHKEYKNICISLEPEPKRFVSYKFSDGKCEMPIEDAYFLISNHSGYYIEGETVSSIEEILALNPFKEIILE